MLNGSGKCESVHEAGDRTVCWRVLDIAAAVLLRAALAACGIEEDAQHAAAAAFRLRLHSCNVGNALRLGAQLATFAAEVDAELLGRHKLPRRDEGDVAAAHAAARSAGGQADDENEAAEARAD